MAERNLRIRMYMQAADKITKPMRDAAAGSSRLSRALGETREKLKAIQRAQADVSSFRQLKSGLSETTLKLQAARAKVSMLSQSLEATENPTRKMRSEFKRAREEVEKLLATGRKQRSDLTELRSRLSDAGIATRDLASHERRLRTEADQTNESLRNQQRRLQEVTDRSKRFAAANERFGKIQGTATGLAAGGAAAVGTGMTVAQPVMAAAKGAMALEESMADVGKVTGMNQPTLKAMSRDFMDMSEVIPMASTGLAAIGASGAAAGVGMDKFGKPMRNQRQQILEFTEDAGKMGIAFDMSAEQAGETMAKWRQGFQLPQSAIRTLGDQVNALTNRFGGTPANIAETLSRVGPLGKISGLAAGSMAALAQSLDSIGIPSEVAATGIKNTMLALVAGDSATKSQAAAMQQLGLDAVKLSKAMQVDAKGTMIDVFERIKKLNPEQQASVLSRLFGKESLTAIAPLLTNLDGLKTRLDLVGNSGEYAGAMQAEFESRTGTATAQAELAKNGLDNLNTTLGDGLLPSIKEGSQIVLGWTQGLRKWMDEHPGLTKAIGITTGVAAGLFLLLGGGAILIAGLVAPFAALGWAASFLGMGMAALVGISLGVVAGLAAIAATAYLVYANWETLRGWWDSFWQAVGNILMAAWNGITSYLGGIWEELKGLFNGGLLGLAGLLISFNPYGLMYAGFAALMNFLGVKMPKTLGQAGMDMIRGLIKGITDMFPNVMQRIKDLAKKIPEPIRKILGIHSPSRVFAQIGAWTVQGLDRGIAGEQDGPVQRINGLASSISKAMVAGASIPVLAATPASASPSTAPASIGAVTITIQQQPGQNSRDLANEIKRIMEDMQRRGKPPGNGGSFGDEPDYGGFL